MDKIQQSLMETVSKGDVMHVSREMAGHNFTLKFLHDAKLDRYLHQQILQEICDLPFFHRLNQRLVTNWCSGATQLVPLKIRGDGNCLVHAACAAMWGIQDRDRT